MRHRTRLDLGDRRRPAADRRDHRAGLLPGVRRRRGDRHRPVHLAVRPRHRAAARPVRPLFGAGGDDRQALVRRAGQRSTRICGSTTRPAADRQDRDGGRRRSTTMAAGSGSATANGMPAAARPRPASASTVTGVEGNCLIVEPCEPFPLRNRVECMSERSQLLAPPGAWRPVGRRRHRRPARLRADARRQAARRRARPTSPRCSTRSARIYSPCPRKARPASASTPARAPISARGWPTAARRARISIAATAARRPRPRRGGRHSPP